MEFRTKIKVEPSPEKISYKDSVMFIGSCFASEMGSQMKLGKMPVMINPAGAVFNPVSVCNTLETINAGKELKGDDLYNNEGTWLSFNHYTDFSGTDLIKVLKTLNDSTSDAHDFLKRSKFLYVTFGTARVYRWKKSGAVVSNCHKIPQINFVNELLTVDAIVSLWEEQLEKLKILFPRLSVIFTISPVRHWKDGAHGNQVSKSVLFLAVERLLNHHTRPGYFPAYEIIMDELRDYRFYNEDMLHPSPVAVNYIWEAFAGSYLDKRTFETWNEAAKIGKALRHRINPESGGKKRFAERMLEQISVLEKNNPEIDFSQERDYFSGLAAN